MNHDLRPMGIWEILGAALGLYERRFATFATISAVVCVPYALVMAALSWAIRHFAPAAPVGDDTSFWSRVDLPHLPDLGASTAASLPLGVTTWTSGTGFQDVGISPLAFIGAVLLALLGAVLFLGLVYPLCQGALILNISAHYLGEELSAAESFSRVFQRLGRLLMAQFLVTVWVLVGALCCIVPGIIAALWFMIVPAVVMLEDHTPSGALRRSRSLMAGQIGRGFLLGLVAALFTYVLGRAGSWVIGLVPWPIQFLGDFLESLVDALTLPLSVGVTVLFYYDLRIRRNEGFDLELLGTKMRDLGVR